MISPYLNFNNKSEEVMNFYKEVFGGTDIKIMYYKDSPPDLNYNISQESLNKVMHGEITICGTTISFCDTLDNVSIGNNICLSITFDTPDEVSKVFSKLKENATIIIDCAPQFFSPMYAHLKDKFNIRWHLISK